MYFKFRLIHNHVTLLETGFTRFPPDNQNKSGVFHLCIFLHEIYGQNGSTCACDQCIQLLCTSENMKPYELS